MNIRQTWRPSSTAVGDTALAVLRPQWTCAAAAGQRLVAVTCRDGGGLPRGIEVHVLADKCAVAVADEAAKLAHFLSRL